MLWSMVLGLACLVAAAACVALSAAEACALRRTRAVKGQVEGTVCGLVCRRPLMRYEKVGEVPDAAWKHWGRTTENGGHGFLSIPQTLVGCATGWVWYPCVRFSLDGEQKEWVALGASRENVWRLGQRVQVKYAPETPVEYALEGDPEPMHSIRTGLVSALVLAVIGAFLLVWYFR